MTTTTDTSGQQPNVGTPASVKPADQPIKKPFEAPTEQTPLPPNVCPNCLAVGETNVEYCESCGFYARFGVVVGGEEELEQEKPFPMGSIIAIAVVFTLVSLFNVVIVFYTPQGSPERTWWSLSQLGLGTLGFIVAHLFCFLRTLNADSSVGLLDFVLRPLCGWLESFELLPKRLWAFLLGTAGVTAILGSVLVLRGIPYNALFAPSEAWARGAIEEAIEDELEEPIAHRERVHKDAVIIAYAVDSQGDVERVILAGVVDKKLRELGIVHEIPDAARKKLTEVLPETVRETPYLASSSFAEKEKSEASEGQDTSATDKSESEHSTSESVSSTTGDSTETTDGDGSDEADDTNVNRSSIKWVHPRWLCRISYVEIDDGIPADLKLHWVVRKLRGKQAKKAKQATTQAK